MAPTGFPKTVRTPQQKQTQQDLLGMWQQFTAEEKETMGNLGDYMDEFCEKMTNSIIMQEYHAYFALYIPFC